MNTSKISKILNKSTLVHIAIIVSVSGVLGFIYNLLQPAPLPLKYAPKSAQVVDDTLLFGTKTDNIDTIKKEEISQQIIQIPKDTSKPTNQNITQNEPKHQEIQINNQIVSDKPSKELKSVNYEQMKKIVGNPDFVIIDARREEDYRKSHIPGAINLFALSDPNEKFNIIMSIPLGKKYVIYCDGGNCDLSHQLAEEFLHSFGFTNVYVYEGGWEEWLKKSQ